MRLIIVLLLLSVIPGTLKTDLEKNHLKGKVKTLTESTYEVVNYGAAGQQATMKGKVATNYNEKGYITTIGKSGKDGIVHPFSINVYDKNDVLTGTDFLKDDSIHTERTLFAYNDKGLTITEKEYDAENKLSRTISYEYDKAGRLTSEKILAVSPKEKKEFRHKYDDKQNTVEYAGYLNGKPGFHITFKCDGNGNSIEETFYAANGSLDYTQQNKYNANNLLAEKINTSAGGTVVKTTIVYDFDNTGNWTKKSTRKDGQLTDIVTRIIEYY